MALAAVADEVRLPRRTSPADAPAVGRTPTVRAPRSGHRSAAHGEARPNCGSRPIRATPAARPPTGCEKPARPTAIALGGGNGIGRGASVGHRHAPRPAAPETLSRSRWNTSATRAKRSIRTRFCRRRGGGRLEKASVLGLQRLGPLMKIGRQQPKLGMLGPKTAGPFGNASLAQQDRLAAGGQRLADRCPFFQGDRGSRWHDDPRSARREGAAQQVELNSGANSDRSRRPTD